MTPLQRKHAALKERLGGGGQVNQNQRARHWLQKRRQSITLPFNAAADTTISGLRNNYDQTLSGLAGQELQTRQSYGFDDPSNPYSIAAQLQSNYRQQKAGSLNNYAGAGQLYSGALQNRLGANQTSYLQNTDKQIRAYQAALGRIAGERVSASNAYTQGVQNARAKALEDAANETPDPTEAPVEPRFVRKYLRRQNKRATRLEKRHPGKAERLRRRLADEE